MAFNHENVYAMLQTQNKHIDLSGRKEDIKAMSAMCCARTAPSDYLMQYESTLMEFSNSMLTTPNDCVRLVDVRDKWNQKIRYRKYSDTNAQILDYTSGEVLVDWWGLPSDDDGLPPISLKQLDYCVAYCKEMIITERYEQGLATENLMNRVATATIVAYNKAKKKTFSRGEMEAALWMMTNGQFYKTTDVLKKRTGGWNAGKVADRDSRSYGNHDKF